MDKTNAQKEGEDHMNEEQSSNTSALVVGALIVVAVVGIAFYAMKGKTSPTAENTAEPVKPVVTTAPAPKVITKLSCDTQYYNPVVGFPKYYLSVEGGDVVGSTKVDCTMTVTAKNTKVAVENISSPLTAAPERGGSTFRCTTKGLELEKNVPTKVDVTLTNDLGQTASCTKTFLLP
ncbi:hypothetical protein HY947_06010 [Candidatus Gottesmanbacteria bacterium]|nr:hypothetical protein [Candidatus Gottesmanbacteria bacterium]